MEVEFSRLDLKHPEVNFAEATFEVEAKRSIVTLNFAFKEDGQNVGYGKKRMVAKGLKPYEQAAVDDLVERFNARKYSFLQGLSNSA